MSKKATKALYHAGDLVVKCSQAQALKTYPNQIYIVQADQLPHEQYIELKRANEPKCIVHEQFIAPYGG